MSVLNVKNISKSYGRFKAVDDISFKVNQGRIYGILGPNGAGKTTTIRMIMNIIIPDTGEITLFGQKMNDSLKQRIGYLPEERGLYQKLSVLDLLVYFGELQNMKKGDAKRKSQFWLKKLEIDKWESKKVEELSKGMQQKIQFIATVLHDPELIILDEPFSGLDPINVQLIKNIMLDFKKEGKAIMFSTHMMEAAEKLCDDILLINKSKKILDGNIVDIKNRYSSNSIQVEYDGDVRFIQDMSQIEKYENYSNYIEVTLSPSYSAQDFLKSIIGKIEIHRYQIMESSLNDIFVRLVGGNDNE